MPSIAQLCRSSWHHSYSPESDCPSLRCDALPPALKPLAVATALIASNPSQAELASFYGGRHHGERTSSGERFNEHALTAAHKTLPFGARVRVSHAGKSVVVRITDRGPIVKGRAIDLSTAAARQIGMIGKGVAHVTITRLR